MGQEAEIPVEGPSRRNPARLEGRRCNKIVVLEGSSDRFKGQILADYASIVLVPSPFMRPAILNLPETVALT